MRAAGSACDEEERMTIAEGLGPDFGTVDGVIFAFRVYVRSRPCLAKGEGSGQERQQQEGEKVFHFLFVFVKLSNRVVKRGGDNGNFF